MEILESTLKKSLDFAKKENLYAKLEDVYSKIPSGKCAGCTKCCTESVNTFYIEFLNIYNYLLERPKLLATVKTKVKEHYFNEFIKPMNCPFLNEKGHCVIYEVRPLVCRTFGYLPKDEHEANYARVLEMNKDAENYFYEEYNVKLNEDVVNHKIEYCEDFVIGREITEIERLEMIDEMFLIDSQFLIEDLLLEDSFNISITTWFIYTEYDEEDAENIRIEKLINYNR